MREAIQTSLETHLGELATLPQRLVACQIPFAIWRKPQSDTCYFLISLEEEQPLDSIHALEDLNEAFLVNSFEDSHPPKPGILKGDIIIKTSGSSLEVSINPTLFNDRIEVFIQRIRVTIPTTARTLRTTPDEDDYTDMVRRAKSQIEQGEFQKVVLARRKHLELLDAPNLIDLHKHLADRYPDAFVYILYTKNHGQWIGATPEKLISVTQGKFFSTDSLAGTQHVKADQALSDVAWTMKEIEEQAMVSRYIIDCFKTIRLREFDELGPKTVKAGSMAHLKTEFKVDMEATNSASLPAVMLDLLHPTSAVCGFPRDKALAFIQQHEGFDRELYSGFLGPVNLDGETNLFVNLRCMKLEGTKATLFAGAGITAGSDPVKEFLETELKMDTLLSVIEP